MYRPDKIQTIQVEMEMPKTCADCPFHRLNKYRVHNEKGFESNCILGYMKGQDMRDKYFRTSRYKECGLKDNIKL